MDKKKRLSYIRILSKYTIMRGSSVIKPKVVADDLLKTRK